MARTNTPSEQEVVEHVLCKLSEEIRTGNGAVTRFAKATGYDRAAVHRVLGNNKLPTLNFLLKASEYFGVPVSYWLPPQFSQFDHNRWTDFRFANTCLLLEQLDGIAPLTDEIIKAAQAVNRQGKEAALIALQSPVLLELLINLTELSESQLTAMNEVVKKSLQTKSRPKEKFDKR